MNNGCVCCTVRGDLIRTLHTLLAGNAARAKPFNAIVVEATGLACWLLVRPLENASHVHDEHCGHDASHGHHAHPAALHDAGIQLVSLSAPGVAGRSGTGCVARFAAGRARH